MGVLEGVIHAYLNGYQGREALMIFLESKNLNSFIATNLCVGVVFFIYSNPK